MDTENLLINKILADCNIQKTLDRKVKKEFFHDALNKQVFGLIISYFDRYGKVPSKGVIRKYYPSFIYKKTPETTDYYLDEILKKEKQFQLKKVLTQSIAFLEEYKPDKAQKHLADGLMTIVSDIDSPQDAQFVNSLKGVYKKYKKRTLMRGMLSGYSYGFNALDMVTDGIHKREVVAILGRPKKGKTWLACVIANTLARQGVRVLFYSAEMHKEQILNRLVCLRFRLSPNNFKRGNLSPQEQKDWKRKIKKLQDFDDYPVIVCTEENENDYNDLLLIKSKIKQYKPDVVIIDGHYLLSAGKNFKADHERIRFLTRHTKKLSRQENVGVILTSQMNRSSVKEGAGLHNAAYSDSYVTDSDVLINYDRTKEDKLYKEAEIEVMGIRDGENIKLKIKSDFETMNFKQLKVISDDEEEEDDGKELKV